MRLQPHERILDIWRAVARHSFRDGLFVRGAAAAGDAISDAEQLLCILEPATTVRHFVLDRAEWVRDDVVKALRLIGDPDVVPMRLIRAQRAYLEMYRDVDGHPVFPAGQYLDCGDDVVESFALSIRFCLAAIGFCRVYRETPRPPEVEAETRHVEDLASIRLSAAMIGLLRSFVVQEFPAGSPLGRHLLARLGQEERDPEAVLREFNNELSETRAGSVEISIGTGRTEKLYADPTIQFACGWSWGVLTDAPEVETDARLVAQRPGIAAAVPDLYFTWIASEAIAHLFAERTRVLTILGEEQQRLARALQLRLELTRAYWSKLATFGDHRWPLERLPWLGGTDYHSLLVATITAVTLGGTRGDTSLYFGYLVRILARLATRHGIVKPPRADGAAPAIRLPGEPVPAGDAVYHGTDFTALLFDAVLRSSVMTDHEHLRQQLGDLADVVWDHLEIDGPIPDLHGFGERPGPDWHNVLRVVTGLTAAASLAEGGLGQGAQPLGFVHQLLADADDAFERLDGHTGSRKIEATLDRARRIIDDHPARAAALLYVALAEIDAALPDG
ncbi:SCO2524 family protein [Actinoplanes solisilvae]|uniref:SCO2524 family protein n=1 Tax=Actinoplanes solisilvae TaxID=2486853 RepID=UPI000FDAC809|nr:SCO2524 family protein [Actinoplanes solisilvae]